MIHNLPYIIRGRENPILSLRAWQHFIRQPREPSVAWYVALLLTSACRVLDKVY
jgi:hypothetical protein